MGCLVYNMLYRTVIQGYRVSSILLKFYGEKKKSIKKELFFPYYVCGDNLLCPCWIVPIVRVFLISWSYNLMSQNVNISQMKKGGN